MLFSYTRKRTQGHISCFILLNHFKYICYIWSARDACDSFFSFISLCLWLRTYLSCFSVYLLLWYLVTRVYLMFLNKINHLMLRNSSIYCNTSIQKTEISVILSKNYLPTWNIPHTKYICIQSRAKKRCFMFKNKILYEKFTDTRQHPFQTTHSSIAHAIVARKK